MAQNAGYAGPGKKPEGLRTQQPFESGLSRGCFFDEDAFKNDLAILFSCQLLFVQACEIESFGLN